MKKNISAILFLFISLTYISCSDSPSKKTTPGSTNNVSNNSDNNSNNNSNETGVWNESRWGFVKWGGSAK